ncbi:MAG: nicotinate-nucleotide adenylyltransferase [Cyanobacteria bacterium P01_D01_bin.115]
MSETASTPMHIALFGTSADPPHRGHYEILQWLSRHYDHVAVWASDNPYKAHQSTLRDRAAMLQLMIQEIPAAAGTLALHTELSHSRSLVSAQRARTHWPTAALTLVVGSDLVPQLPRWYQAAELFQLVQILIIPRPRYDLSDDDLQAIRRHGGQAAIADIPQTFDISSSHYRRTDDPDALPAAVKAYIDQHHLYLCTESSKEKQPIF